MTRLRRAVDVLRGTPTPGPSFKEFKILQTTESEVELAYPVPFSGVANRRLEARVTVERAAFEARQTWMAAKPKITNHDHLAFHCFTRLLDRVEASPASVLEIGTFRGVFLRNLADHAQRKGLTLKVTAVDTFEEFPDTLRDEDMTIHDRDVLEHKMGMTKPDSTAAIRQMLESYDAVAHVDLLKTNVLALPRERQFAADIVHIDTDTYDSIRHALDLIDLSRTRYLIVDDYYQPSWPGAVLAVNEFCAANRYVPVNIADYLGFHRSQRLCFNTLLIPSRA